MPEPKPKGGVDDSGKKLKKERRAEIKGANT
jgi:hypothetical protein